MRPWAFIRHKNKQTNYVALSPQANYTDLATATCRRNLVPTFVDRGVSRGQRGGSPTVVNLSFLDRIYETLGSNLRRSKPLPSDGCRMKNTHSYCMM
jgi:hypothetical protein